MNIFILDNEPVKAAEYHSDVHVIKMILESAQLLCTAHHCAGTNPDNIPYKKTHQNHPSAVWARTNKSNYLWLAELGLALCAEYTYRYGKTHKTEEVLCWAAKNIPNIPAGSQTEFAQAMPDECKDTDAVRAYRNYYIRFKSEFSARGSTKAASWKKRGKPSWFD